MGVDTKIMIPKGEYTVERVLSIIAKLVEDKLGIVTNNDLVKHSIEIKENYSRENHKLEDRFGQLYVILPYENKSYANSKECRTIWCFYKTGELFFNIRFGAWGHNKELANIIVDYFGGTADYCDCDDMLIDYAQPQRKKTI